MLDNVPTPPPRAGLNALANSPMPLHSKPNSARRAPDLNSAAPHASIKGLPGLTRSSHGRSLSRFRYHNAEAFFSRVEFGSPRQQHARLYHIGIVLQLGISSHLLDVGFEDEWCARHIGLHISTSLAYANATGLGHDVPDLDLLAGLLSPYNKWRHIDETAGSSRISLSDARVIQLTRDLLNHVRIVTGHPRPRKSKPERSAAEKTSGQTSHDRA